jgi:hypothetical protein
LGEMPWGHLDNRVFSVILHPCLPFALIAVALLFV